MDALVLERKGELSFTRLSDRPGLEARCAYMNHTVGICGSDVHYYEYGAIGPFVVRSPMILGHEAAGTITEIGSKYRIVLVVGDRVCMPSQDADSGTVASAREGNALPPNPQLRFWATPPIHGVLRPSVVHPAAFTFKLPDNVSFAEGAMVEPLAVGMHAAMKARIQPGDVAVVIGAGPIGLVTALAALLPEDAATVRYADHAAAKAGHGGNCTGPYRREGSVINVCPVRAPTDADDINWQ